MDRYYYLIAQLPTLYFDKETYMTVGNFFAEAEKWLSQQDFQLLTSISMEDVTIDKKNVGVLNEYKKFEFQVRNDIAQWRKAQKMGQEYKPLSFPLSTIKDGNPLEIEKKLLKLRWEYIDEIERAHHFDMAYVILYLLKLQILTKLFTYDKELGLQSFQNLCEVEV